MNTGVAVLGRAEAVHGAAHSNDRGTRREADAVQGDGRAGRGGEEQDTGRSGGGLHGTAAIPPRHQEVHAVRQQSQGLQPELRSVY